MGLFEKLKKGLEKTKEGLVDKIEQVFTFRTVIDEELYEELEEVLLSGDISVDVVFLVLEELRERVRKERVKEPAKMYDLLKDELQNMLLTEEPLQVKKGRMNVILVVGVNGVGKTTTIGKLAKRLKDDGYKVLLAAGDTFRAAAVEQLSIWAHRVGVDIIQHGEGGDPSAVVYDALQAGKSRGNDVVIIDTAGRLHNKKNLMQELAKIHRVIAREVAEAPHETLLVIDATTGQNGLYQAQAFDKATDISGVVLTKLDGTAKGGIVLSISKEYGVPIKYVGVGEQIDDLQPFKSKDFVEALFAR